MSRMTVRYAITGALAVGLLAGCAGSSHMARAGDHAVRTAKNQSRSINAAEQTVAQAPNDAAARLALGQAYLDAGRFQSAATTFSDAIQLGDSSSSVQLRLALARIGAGDMRGAAAVLDQARDTIQPADRGLALALAGQTGRGVAVLIDALRGGENSPKLRQNLAYAYALNGQWREARVAMSQDVPADQIDDRIGDWAAMSRPEDVQRRVASLLAVPVGVADAGQPVALALSGVAEPKEQRAEAEPAPVTRTADAELPAIGETPAPAVAAVPAPASAEFATAFAAQPQSNYVAQPVVQPAAQVAVADYAAKPSLQAAPARASRVAAFTRAVAERPSAPKLAAPRKDASRPMAWPAAVKNGTHLVQLGSFSSEANARRAVGILTARSPELRGYQMTITPAVVNGKNFWRVAAAGFNGGSASSLCSGLKSRGNVCFAYAANRAPAGQVQPSFAVNLGGGRARAR
ncbi:SPOR domain-containing protein [Novosphingobium sp. G106]|uniref:SPOR domain-containing protein n=1 Tax=Novosphingobium sp. G106 TaxID=2849500 RepID=UPI001C2D141D|nr:SPOR domain-containing protein [Novosphingobium sp. G106]MBV1688633.1 SPOR domain-containing protein [Novosphingobium sp. G106]